ncbi:MAG: lysylphosphatidylglycerol synthase transmembrane domain-containing protein [Gemmatimonadales bacterium]
MKLWLKIIVSAGLLAALFVLVPWHQVREALTRLSPGLWLGVLAGFAAGHLVGVIKWRSFVNACRGRLRRLDAALCYSAGLFANLCLPSIIGGDVLRLGIAGRLTRRPEAALWGGVMDRLSDMIALALLAAAGGILSRDQLTGWTAQLLSLGLVLGIGVALLGVPLLLRRPIRSWPRRFRRPVARSLVALRRLWQQPAVFVRGLGLSLAIQGSFVLLNAWIGRSLGIDVPLSVWFLTWPLAKTAGLLPISLGGLAVREASLAALLLPFGVPAALAVVASLLWQTVLIGGGLLGGAIWLVLSRVRHLPIGMRSGEVGSAGWSVAK